MTNYSPKIEIINHFDKLINRVDIDIEESLKKYDDKRIIGELKTINWINYWKHYQFDIIFHDTINTSKQANKHETLDIFPESTKVIDYLKQVRMTSIEELRKAQEDTLENYKLNLSRFTTSNKNIDQLKSELFAEKFYFQVHITQSKRKVHPFRLFTFVTDFYMSPSDIDTLEKFISGDKDPFCMRVFDEKLVLIGLLYSRFIKNLMFSKNSPPKHMIRVSKQEFLNIRTIIYTFDFIGVNLTNSSIIDFSKLEILYLNGAEFKSRSESIEINIEGLSSLESMFLGLHASEAYSFSIRNLYPLKSFSLQISDVIDESILTVFLNKLPNIEKLGLHGNLSNFNLDHLINLKSLVLNGTINDDFNFKLFENLCYQLQDLKISFRNDYESISAKLLDGHSFSNLQELTIYNSNIRRLKNKFLDKFPSLLRLQLNKCNIEIIEDDAFSSIEKLTCLELMGNFLKTLEKRSFSHLTNLEELNLLNNQIESIEKDTFLNMKNLRVLNLRVNKFPQLDRETLDRFKNLEKLEL